MAGDAHHCLPDGACVLLRLLEPAGRPVGGLPLTGVSKGSACARASLCTCKVACGTLHPMSSMGSHPHLGARPRRCEGERGWELTTNWSGFCLR